MAIKVTRWSPDTCGCSFDYEWDDSTSENTRTHNFKSVAKECASHAHLQGNNKRDMYDSSLEENRRKNKSFQRLVELAGVDFVDFQADGSYTWKNGITATWTWSGTAPNRIITIRVTGKKLNQNQINNVQNILNTEFGTGKVVFDNPF